MIGELIIVGVIGAVIFFVIGAKAVFSVLRQLVKPSVGFELNDVVDCICITKIVQLRKGKSAVPSYKNGSLRIGFPQGDQYRFKKRYYATRGIDTASTQL